MYRCNGRCGNTEVDKDVLEDLVFEKLIENIFSKNALGYLAKKLNNYLKSKKQQENKQLEFLKSRIDEITFEQNNIISAISKGYDQPIFKQKLTTLDEELKKIRYDYEITKLKLDTKKITPNEIGKNLLSQRDHVLNRNIIEVKNFISSYVNSVIIYTNDIEVNLKYDSMPL